MSTFGKVLLFLNVLLVIVVLTLFGLNVGQEKRWAAAVYIHELPIIGLPMDEDEVDPQDPSTKRVHKLTKPILAAFYDFPDDPELGGDKTMKTVLGEVERVRGKVKSKISSEANDLEKRKLYYGYLVPLSRSLIEREELIRRINDPKEPIANLEAELDRRFAEAKAPGGRSVRSEQRHHIATLFFHLKIDANWRNRVMRIVGMETYVAAVERQSQHNFAMARELKALVVQDQTQFEKQYADLIEQIMTQSEEIYYINKYLAELNATLAERQQQVAKRTTEVESAQTALDVATKNTQTETAKLNAIQKDLFDLQLRVGQAIQKNQELEQDLRKLEAKKPGL